MAYLVHDGNDENYTLKVDNPSRKKLKIYLYAGGVRYSYYASAPHVSKLFDFNGAEDGVYTFVIKDGKTKIEKRNRNFYHRFNKKRKSGWHRDE